MKKDGYQLLPNIVGDNDQDTAMLLTMAADAQSYIGSFDWCPPISASYLAFRRRRHSGHIPV
jgi:hypothetical protein